MVGGAKNIGLKSHSLTYYNASEKDTHLSAIAPDTIVVAVVANES